MLKLVEKYDKKNDHLQRVPVTQVLINHYKMKDFDGVPMMTIICALSYCWSNTLCQNDK